VTDDLKSIGAGHDLINSMNIIVSSEMIETDMFDSTKQFGRSGSAIVPRMLPPFHQLVLRGPAI
jgi:hypothetical protein